MTCDVPPFPHETDADQERLTEQHDNSKMPKGGPRRDQACSTANKDVDVTTVPAQQMTSSTNPINTNVVARIMAMLCTFLMLTQTMMTTNTHVSDAIEHIIHVT